MTAFYGEYNFVMDAKNRIFIPAKFRETLKKEKKNFFMITIGIDKCLYMFLPSVWDDLIKNNMEIFRSENKQEERAFKRFFFSNAIDSHIDEQGRILINNSHKEYAGIKKNVSIIGVGNKIELWSKENWENYKNTEIAKSVKKFSRILDI